MYQFDREAYDTRMQWFREARFGMFIHWGLYAIPARGEWIRNNEEMPEEEYHRYFREFDRWIMIPQNGQEPQKWRE